MRRDERDPKKHSSSSTRRRWERPRLIPLDIASTAGGDGDFSEADGGDNTDGPIFS